MKGPLPRAFHHLNPETTYCTGEATTMNQTENQTTPATAGPYTCPDAECPDPHADLDAKDAHGVDVHENCWTAEYDECPAGVVTGGHVLPADATWGCVPCHEQLGEVYGQSYVDEHGGNCWNCDRPLVRLFWTGTTFATVDPTSAYCNACNALPGEPCHPGCIGLAAATTLQDAEWCPRCGVTTFLDGTPRSAAAPVGDLIVRVCREGCRDERYDPDVATLLEDVDRQIGEVQELRRTENERLDRQDAAAELGRVLEENGVVEEVGYDFDQTVALSLVDDLRRAGWALVRLPWTTAPE